MDMTVFVASVRRPLFGGKMSESQISGCERLVNAWERWGYDLDTGLAYILATSWWETGQRMQPVRETFATSNQQAIERLEKAFKAGKLKWVKTPYWREGWFGRGDVQLTHESNYAGPIRDAVWAEFGIDIHQDPNALLDPEISAYVLIEGATKAVTVKADFTKFALEDFVNESKTDYVNARKVINPADKSSYQPIAKAALVFEEAIRKAREAAGEEFKHGAGVAADIYNGQVWPEVKSVQVRLKDLGYTEVGNPDGRWGSRTKGAVLGFRSDNDLPLEPVIDDVLLAALMRAKPRQVAVQRATASLADIPKVEVQDGVSMASLGKWMGIGGLGLGSANGAVTLDGLTSQIGEVQAFVQAVKAALPYLLVAALGIAVWYVGRKFILAQLAAYREGRLL